MGFKKWWRTFAVDPVKELGFDSFLIGCMLMLLLLLMTIFELKHPDWDSHVTDWMYRIIHR